MVGIFRVIKCQLLRFDVPVARAHFRSNNTEFDSKRFQIKTKVKDLEPKRLKCPSRNPLQNSEISVCF